MQRRRLFPTLAALLCVLLLLPALAGAKSRPMPFPRPPMPMPMGVSGEGVADEGDKTMSPYFKVLSDDPTIEQLPLKATTADVSIAGVISDIRVTQVYKNEGQKPIEAIYVFPASTRAAVYGLKMTIGDRTIVAHIKKKEEARQEYEQAKQQGKSASLLEQDRPNVFTMNVANILPGDEIKVEMSYTELLVPTDGVYEFMYPTVVGPRYNGGNAPGATAPKDEKWVANPYLQEGEAPKTTFDIKVTLSAGLPIQEATCGSHKVSVSYEGPALAKIALDPSEKFGGNRDFILKYRLAGGKIESGLLLSEGDKENFFLLMVQPPKQVEAKQIPAREYVFIVDVSGSMHGFPLDMAKRLLKNLIGSLRPTDLFNVMLFSGGNKVLSENGSMPATEENIEMAMQVIGRQSGGGSTEILPAFKRTLELPRAPGVSRSIVVVTDGYVTVEKEVFDMIRKNLDRTNFYSFGIGSAVNRFIIEGMARVGMGEPLVITKPDQAEEKAEKFRKYIQSPVLTGIKTEFGNFDVHAVEPISVPDVLAERPVIIFGKWRGKPEGKITLTGTSGEGEFTQTFDVSTVKPLPANAALRYLWARHRIAMLSDYNNLWSDPEIVAEVTKLGLDYNLLTNYTSFVAVDSLVRAKPGDLQTVQQPLPLPEGVSNLAIGGAPAPSMAMRSKSMSADSFSAQVDREEASESKKEYSRGPSAPLAQEPGVAAPPPPPTGAVEKAKKPDVGSPVKLGGIMASGRLNADAVRSAIEGRISELEELYKKAKAKSSRLAGKLGVELKIGPDGVVKSAKSTSSDLGEAEFEKAVLEWLKKIVFKAPGGKDDLEITLMLTFG